MDLEDNKVKVDWIYLRKFVIGPVRGDQFLYVLLEIGYKYSFDCYCVSFFVLCSPSLRVPPPFYIIFTFHLHPPRADQIVNIDPCPISTFLKSLSSCCKTLDIPLEETKILRREATENGIELVYLLLILCVPLPCIWIQNFQFRVFPLLLCFL